MTPKFFLSIRKLLIFLIIVCGFSTKLFSQWDIIDTETNLDFIRIVFADSLNGWAMNSYRILHTEDGGVSWTEQFIPSDSTELRDCFFPSKNVGYIIGRGGLILSTKDGGNSWIRQEGPASHLLRGISFANEEEGWITGETSDIKRGGILLHTTTGGAKWDTLSDRSDGILYYDVKFGDSNNGIVIGSYGFDNFDPTYVYSTDDGGKTLTKISEFDRAQTFELYMNNSDTIWAGGFGFARSFDNGLKWSSSYRLEAVDTSFFLIIFTDLLNIDNKNGWACISNVRGPNNITARLFNTHDYGDSWDFVETPVGFLAYSLAYSGIELFVGGNKGVILKKKLLPVGVHDEPMIIDNFELFQNYPNPFNPTTNISYQLSEESIVRLSIFNSLGEEIKILVNELQKPDKYNVIWNSENTHNQQVSSGIYFFRIKVGDQIKTRKAILIQ